MRCGFVDVVRQRYDVVLMNPPFGEPVPETKPISEPRTPGFPPRTTTCSQHSSAGDPACKPRRLPRRASPLGRDMFLATFEQWRRQIRARKSACHTRRPWLGVMEQAIVEAAAYVIVTPGIRRTPDCARTFIRLLKDPDRASRGIAASRVEQDSDRRIFGSRPSDFNVPGPGRLLDEPTGRLFTDACQARRGEWRRGPARPCTPVTTSASYALSGKSTPCALLGPRTKPAKAGAGPRSRKAASTVRTGPTCILWSTMSMTVNDSATSQAR